MMPAPLMLTVAEAATLLGIDPSTAYALIRRGDFPVPDAVRTIGGRLKVSRLQLERWASGEHVPVPTGVSPTATVATQRPGLTDGHPL